MTYIIPPVLHFFFKINHNFWGLKSAKTAWSLYESLEYVTIYSYKNFMALFGPIIIPNFLAPFVPDIKAQGAIVEQENNFIKVLIVLFFLISLLYYTYQKRFRQTILLRVLLTMPFFFIAHTILNSWHLPVTIGYYYGSNFSLLATLLIASIGKEGQMLGDRMTSFFVGVVGALIIIQSTNFHLINQNNIDIHGKISKSMLPPFKKDLPYHPMFRENGHFLDKKEIALIWQKWKAKKLPDYIKNNKINISSLFLVTDLGILDRKTIS